MRTHCYFILVSWWELVTSVSILEGMFSPRLALPAAQTAYSSFACTVFPLLNQVKCKLFGGGNNASLQMTSSRRNSWVMRTDHQSGNWVLKALAIFSQLFPSVLIEKNILLAITTALMVQEPKETFQNKCPHWF